MMENHSTIGEDIGFKCGTFLFTHNFDSGNLGHVEQVPPEDIEPSLNSATNILETPDYEFNIWTRPDCAGSEFENGNRTWFYFGVQGAPPNVLVKLNIVNLNRQGKMYSQGMAPVTKTIPGKNLWERIKDRPTYFTIDNIFTMSFKYRTPENVNSTSYFAFTYPYTYADLQTHLSSIESKLSVAAMDSEDDIYFCRENVCYSLDGRRMDMLTISSRHGITKVREEKLKNLFPDPADKRPYKFENKKTIFVSARVHPGETPSSFVMNGLLSLLIHPTDPVAVGLRRLFVFKLVPFLNPDGVARGHYRTDTRGVNLNRVYLAPSLELHPTVYAARALIRFYHFGYEKEDIYDEGDSCLVPPPCEIDSSDNFTPPHLETKCYPSNTKRKKISKNNTKNWTSSQNHKSDSAPIKPSSARSRPPLRSKAVGSGNNTPSTSQHKNYKLKVDSEDDTTSSIVITRPTLADQVEDLNLNELQQSINSFDRSVMDEECAVDHIIHPPGGRVIKNTPLSKTFRALPSLEPITDDDDDEDSASCGPRPFSFGVSTAANKGNARMPAPPTAGGISVSNSLKFSKTWCASCKKTVNNLESRMPGISSIVPSRYKDMAPGWSSERCINCHSDLTTQHQSTPNNNKGIQLPTSAASARDSNENYLTTASRGSSSAPAKGKMPPKIVPLKGRGLAGDKDSGLYLYLDLHGHASKKGIFMYGNHFDDVENCVECMLLPRIMSLNNMHFHFLSCNFSERNMYLRDRRDGMSREGSGRVAVLKATGLTRSYTLECNYNTGKMVNQLPPIGKELLLSPANSPPLSPPKYTPHLFEEVGKSIGASILDLTGQNPVSRVPNSEHRSLHGVKEWLKNHSKTQTFQVASSCPSTSNHSSRHSRVRDPMERKENVLTEIPPVRPNTTSRLRSAKFMSRNKVLADQSFTSKSQRNLSLISIKKPATSKHNRTFKTPLRSKSPSRRMLLGMKQKSCQDNEGGKETSRSVKDKNIKDKINKHKAYEGGKAKVEYKEKDLLKPKSDVSTCKKQKLRNKDALYQKQPSQFVTKPVNKRLKISQFLKYSDNSKEKYRVRKNSTPRSGASHTLASIGQSWEGVSELTKLYQNIDKL